MNWQELSVSEKEYLSKRFGTYNLDPELAYNELIPDIVKQKGSEFIIFYLEHKDISHVYPKHDYPDLEESLNNVFLEDPQENRARKSEIASISERLNAWLDNISDALDHDFDDDGEIDL